MRNTFEAKYFDELSNRELYEILKARSKIFMMEQDIRCLDMDDIDYRSLHCFFFENGQVTAYLRAFYDDENAHDEETIVIGRVLTTSHGLGTGRKLMEQSIKAIKEKLNCDRLRLNAQKYAVGFYEKFGFAVNSEEFLEEGIVHVSMERRI